MAKSLRSKSKLQAKSVKRKGEFSKFVDERNKRIAEKLLKETAKQEEAKKQKQADKENGAVAEAINKESMDVDNKEPKKVSTSGWRDSNSQRYKQRKSKSGKIRKRG
ncbi:uncharacterized protein KGF55_000056 [Candida pseudojiufengensis]|uniref:uncharacterized protein n=1 Tax=Candida pseudojiufengensis TaxID=497109 RepID=UPI0022258675|nr:uncharacterized protein KGF55_000056 [Candida pseudojiufengensis]KAI5967824.1 hypothetical protein KGF55_000056 [Candida pseudojiufengensis]